MKYVTATLVGLAVAVVFVVIVLFLPISDAWLSGTLAARLAFASGWGGALGFSVALAQLAYLASRSREVESEVEELRRRFSLTTNTRRLSDGMEALHEARRYLELNERGCAQLRLSDATRTLSSLFGSGLVPERLANRVARLRKSLRRAAELCVGHDATSLASAELIAGQAVEELSALQTELADELGAQNLS